MVTVQAKRMTTSPCRERLMKHRQKVEIFNMGWSQCRLRVWRHHHPGKGSGKIAQFRKKFSTGWPKYRPKSMTTLSCRKRFGKNRQKIEIFSTGWPKYRTKVWRHYHAGKGPGKIAKNWNIQYGVATVQAKSMTTSPSRKKLKKNCQKIEKFNGGGVATVQARSMTTSPSRKRFMRNVPKI